ncbi:MAG TPA: RidA family protein [Candidatus Binatus sp.]|nr:RidA family protein [Candidatus Binatus sp.]
MKTARNPETVHAPVGRYVHQIEVSGTSRLLFLSGQVGMRLDGTVPDDATEQLEIAYQNIVRNLEAAGLGLDDLVKVTIYLVHGSVLEEDMAKRRAAIDRVLGDRVVASTLVFVAALAAPRFKVEVDAWAVREA